jgi:Pyridoxamine 5'-phosphate oxidase
VKHPGRLPRQTARCRVLVHLYPRAMGKVYQGIDDHLRGWIARQHMFFVGTAPGGDAGHVNISPKGPIGTLRVLDDRTVAYLDKVGSGAETIAHLRDNGRIVIMLCAFAGPPRIVRLHGRGEIVSASDPRFEDMLDRAGFDEPAAPETRRAVIVVDVDRIADSCGYGVPLMSYEGERRHLDAWAAKRLRVGGPDAIARYQREKNEVSIDGLPAVDPAELVRHEVLVESGVHQANGRAARNGSGPGRARRERGHQPALVQHVQLVRQGFGIVRAGIVRKVAEQAPYIEAVFGDGAARRVTWLREPGGGALKQAAQVVLRGRRLR